ncbi:MAG: hypothetical protein KJ847_01570 [Firmicutes bacterium]|nr:hypothetical protein [Bacillota bacterium]
MPLHCKICNNKFGEGSDSIVLCHHKDGPVHLGCCIELCSWDKKPCENAIGVYEKL